MKNDGIFSSSSALKGTKRLRQYTFDRKIGSVGLILFFTVFVLVSGLVVTAEAGTVYGHVSLDGAPFPPQGVLTFSDKNGESFNIQTDQNGKYNTFLPQGFHTVTFVQEGTTWSATIRSYPNPVRWDICLQKQQEE